MGAALLSLVACSLLLITAADKYPNVPPRKYCGNQLSSSLSEFCKGVFKRDDPLSTNDVEYEDSTMSEFSGSDEMFRDREDALSMIGYRLFRKRTGAATECCHKACNISELMAYCGVKKS